ncbi:MAG: ParB N-terminal domain-containing protein [Planctomycetaceae bacterium]|nr:ParB N-terminal domain-containing protein [Planctomycetaceae bacterium]
MPDDGAKDGVMGTETIDISVRDVIVKDAPRRDLGDTTSLMVSMEKYGQLQPIGIDLQNNLIFGERRLDAAVRAGWDTIRATRFDDKDEATEAMGAEMAENTERKDFTPLEMRAMAKRLEELEPRKAGGRPPKSAEDEEPEITVPQRGTVSEAPKKPRKRRDRIAAAVGTSAEKLRKIDVVATAAEQPDAPPEVKAAAEEMERTGKVEPAFQAVQAATAPPRNPVDVIAAKVGSILETVAPLERECRELCDLDPTKDRAKIIEFLGKFIAAVKGQKRRLTPKPVDETDRYIEQLWQLYPRKANKGQAVKAIDKALKTVAFIDLKAAVEEYAEAMQGEEIQFIPHPATWFNARKWEDDRSTWRPRNSAKPRDKLSAFDEWVPPDQRSGNRPRVIETTATRVPAIEHDDESKLPF